MSKFHKIRLDSKDYLVRDIAIEPFAKKFRVAPLSLKLTIEEKLKNDKDIDLIRFINNKIHFYIHERHIIKEDAELSEYLTSNVPQLKNNIII